MSRRYWFSMTTGSSSLSNISWKDALVISLIRLKIPILTISLLVSGKFGFEFIQFLAQRLLLDVVHHLIQLRGLPAVALIALGLLPVLGLPVCRSGAPVWIALRRT